MPNCTQFANRERFGVRYKLSPSLNRLPSVTSWYLCNNSRRMKRKLREIIYTLFKNERVFKNIGQGKNVAFYDSRKTLQFYD